MDDTDIYYLCKACDWWDESNTAEFYYNLTEEMIDKRWTEIRKRRNQAGQPIEYLGYIKIAPHCTPNNKRRKRKTPDGLKDTKLLAQPKCNVCRAKTTYVCRNCGYYLCHDKYGRFYLDTHYEERY